MHSLPPISRPWPCSQKYVAVSQLPNPSTKERAHEAGCHVAMLVVCPPHHLHLDHGMVQHSRTLATRCACAVCVEGEGGGVAGP